MGPTVPALLIHQEADMDPKAPILLICHEPKYTQSLMAEFRSHGWVVAQFSDANLAVDYVAEHEPKPFVVVLTGDLFAIRGHKTTERLFTAAGKRLPVIVFNSAHAEFKFMPLWKQLQVNYVLSEDENGGFDPPLIAKLVLRFYDLEKFRLLAQQPEDPGIN